MKLFNAASLIIAMTAFGVNAAEYTCKAVAEVHELNPDYSLKKIAAISKTTIILDSTKATRVEEFTIDSAEFESADKALDAHFYLSRQLVDGKYLLTIGASAYYSGLDGNKNLIQKVDGSSDMPDGQKELSIGLKDTTAVGNKERIIVAAMRCVKN